MPHYEYLFVPRTEDIDADLEVAGTLPASLSGTFYGIGGTGCQVGDAALHPLDAHARVVAVAIANGEASLRARMVDTPLWRAERGASDVVKRRLFRNKPDRWSNLFDTELGNPAGHNVVRWGKDLVAANDPGFFVLDPVTLETRGPAPIAPTKGASFSPMPRRDPSSGRHVLFEVRPGLRDTIVVREIEDDFTLAVERTYRLPRGGAFFHDVAMTEHYYLIVQFASVSLPTFLWGSSFVGDALRFDARSTPMLHLLPRGGGSPVSVPLPGGRLHFHFWNAYEREGRVVADAIGYAGRVDFRSTLPPKARPAGEPSPAPTPASATWRYVIDPTSRRAEAEKLTDVVSEVPEIHPARRGRPYRYGWAPTPGEAGDEEDRNSFTWFHALARHDFESRTTQRWDAGRHRYVSGAAFVPRHGAGAEDDGHVLAFVQDVENTKTSVAIFDAADIAAGPVAELSYAGLLGGLTHVAFG